MIGSNMAGFDLSPRPVDAECDEIGPRGIDDAKFDPREMTLM
jgi:hypothetical protein